MNQYYFFTAFKLVIRVQYASEANSIRYASHRCLEQEEKRKIEQFILQNFAPKTDYYDRMPSLFLYMGVDSNLAEKLQEVENVNLKQVVGKSDQIDKQVKTLINSSLSNYYFERIGEKLVTLRHMLKKNEADKKIDVVLFQIVKLLEAYNAVSEKQVTLESILPESVINKKKLMSE